MCLFPRILYNKKYQPNKQNQGNVPEAKDSRFLRVQARCGKCIQCRKQIAREWQQRLSEELKTSRGYFVTFTFEDDALQKLKLEVSTDTEYIEKYGEENAIAKRAIELWRKRLWKQGFKERHWLITELGHEGTERVHLHGIVFTEAAGEAVRNSWPFGYADSGQYCNERSIGYVVKYVHKMDHDHPDFRGKIFASKGLGRGWNESWEAGTHRYRSEGRTKDFFRLRSGQKVALAGYYRNYLYSGEEKEALWAEKLDQGYRFSSGFRFSTKTQKELRTYYEALMQRQRDNCQMGYPRRGWDILAYDKTIQDVIAIKNIDEETWRNICRDTEKGVLLLL